MTPRRRIAAASLVILVGVIAPAGAQFTVYDPANYAEAVVQYEQMLRHYEFLLKQARRVPVDIETRYHAHSHDWASHDLTGLLYAEPLLTALNNGDASGSAYRHAIAPLDRPTDIVDDMSTDLRQRLSAAYATIELTDSMMRLAIDEAGIARQDGPFTLQAIRNVEHDIVNPDDDFHSQTALLEKINAAEAVALRVGHQTNQFLLTSLEQQLVESMRKRGVEAVLVNATIYQWRYGETYGADLFRNTAADLDGWRSY